MPSRTKQGGFSLIELMIASLISLILLAGVVLIAVSASRTQDNLEQIGEQLENGRYAISILEDQIPHAGFYGDMYDLPPQGTNNPPLACTTNLTNLQGAMWLPIQGFDSPSGNPTPTCIADADHLDGTDILVIRRSSTATTDIGDLVAGELYLQARSDNHVLAVADGTEAAGSGNQGAFSLRNREDTAPAEIRKYHVDIFYIDPDVDGVPTLVRQSLTGSGGALSWATEPLVAGIEQMQIDYGIDRNGDATPEETTPGSSGDAYVTAPATGNEDDVVTVRVHLIARSVEPARDYTDNKAYDLGAAGSWDPTDDSFRRRAFVTTIRAVNPSIRRE